MTLRNVSSTEFSAELTSSNSVMAELQKIKLTLSDSARQLSGFWPPLVQHTEQGRPEEAFTGTLEAQRCLEDS